MTLNLTRVCDEKRVMNYEAYLKNDFKHQSTAKDFETAVSEAVRNFPANEFFRKIENGQLKIEHYHDLLQSVYFQSFHGPATLALASANCPADKLIARQYLMHHAEEEKDHWIWVLDDLKNSGYRGTDPRAQFPDEATAAYVAFNFYMAHKFPMGRLAVAMMLESLGAHCGEKYAKKCVEVLKLKPEQATFFMRHGVTDTEHIKDLEKIIFGSQLNAEEWAWMCYACRVAMSLYQRIYDRVATR